MASGPLSLPLSDHVLRGYPGRRRRSVARPGLPRCRYLTATGKGPKSPWAVVILT